MDAQHTRIHIRKAILEMDKPFCITDLLIRLKNQGITNKGLILRVLDEMYNEGLIKYERVSGFIDDPDSEQRTEWAFRVAS